MFRDAEAVTPEVMKDLKKNYQWVADQLAAFNIDRHHLVNHSLFHLSPPCVTAILASVRITNYIQCVSSDIFLSFLYLAQQICVMLKCCTAKLFELSYRLMPEH